jgi:branched-chain amino acid transport system ATP-binding protein
VSLLALENVDRRFGGILALDGLTLDVGAAETVGLIGPNGAGKTTAFNIITRLHKPDAGDVVFDGRSLLHTPPHRVVALGIARTFQNVELFPTMTARETVLAGAHVRRGARTADEVLDYVGLGAVAGRVVRGLPFGTLKRVELARALASSPRLLLLDEPAGGLNHEEVTELGELIRRVRADFGLSILLVEHHRALVMSLADRVHVLDFGRTIASGTPREVQSSPAVIEAYLGAPA